MRKHLIFIFFLSISMLLKAQQHIVERLGIEQGLSNNYVVSIAEDQQGFLWFATEEGLNKFDGTRFTTFLKDNQGITGNELNHLYADPIRPIIWIATQRAGLNAYNYDTHTFTTYQSDKSNPHALITNDVTDIAPVSETRDGLWISTYHRGVDYLDIHSGVFTHYNKATVPALASEQTWTVLDGGDGNLYIGHVGAGLSVLRLKDKSVKNFKHIPNDIHSLPGDDVYTIYKDTNGTIWIGTNQGLALFNPQTESFITFRDNPGDTNGALTSYIFSIRQLKDNKLWIATEFNGIAVLDLQQSRFLSPNLFKFDYIREGDDEYGLSNASVRYIYQDTSNNIWIGTWGGGINFIGSEPPLFKSWTYSSAATSHNYLSFKTVSSICADRKGSIWVGTDGDGINVFESGQRVTIHKKETGALHSNSVLAALRDSEENLWFGTFMGSISYYHTRENRFQDIFPDGNTQLDVRVFYEDHQQNIWIGCNVGIYVYSLKERKIIKHYDTKNSQLPENFVRSIAQDAQGNYWIGTFGGGIAVYTPQFERIKSFTQHNGFCSNTINQIFRDSRQRMWIATGEGLAFFPEKYNSNYQVFKRKEGLNSTHIRAIAEDDNGNIWLSTNMGISCYIASKRAFYNYGHFDGIPQGNFISGSVAKDQNGYIYFGSINGVSYFNPEHTVNERKAPEAVITEMKLFGRLTNQENKDTIISVSNISTIELNHEQNSFSLTLNVRNYALAKQVEYAYILKGLENAWYTVNELNSVTFRNIPPGKYEFQVKTRIHNQDWSNELTTLIIQIKPPLWLTWWAKLIYVVTAAIILYLIIRAYKKKIDLESLYQLEKKNHVQEQELNKERLRFYTNITHELRTPLTLIIGPLEDMIKDITLSKKHIQKVSVIHQSANRLLKLINQILEFRKTETQNKTLSVNKGNLTQLIYETGLKYKELNRNPDVSFKIEAEAEPILIYFDKEIITIILDNLISNAIKYTVKGEITLSLFYTHQDDTDYAEIKVSDTGHGISPQALPHIFERYYQENTPHQASGTGIGLALVKNLVVLHQGEIGIESIPGQGSDFSIRLLANNTYPHALHTDSLSKEEVMPKEQSLTEAESSDNNKPILLTIEDNEDIRDYIHETFTNIFEVIQADNGAKGKELAIKHIPDIIVSDIMMPVMDGISLCQQLKQDVRTSHIPIILLTAKDSLQDKEDGYQVGADSYLTKPFSANLLHSRINNLLESRRKLIAQFSSDLTLKEKRTIMAESLTKLDNEFIDKVTLLIEENLSSEKVDIGYLSDKMCMSSSTLYRKMKALSGLSTNEFIRKVKMQNAEHFLLEGKYTISEIAFKVGINSTVYFRQCFKEEYGLSPSDYLKKIMQ